MAGGDLDRRLVDRPHGFDRDQVAAEAARSGGLTGALEARHHVAGGEQPTVVEVHVRPQVEPPDEVARVLPARREQRHDAHLGVEPGEALVHVAQDAEGQDLVLCVRVERMRRRMQRDAQRPRRRPFGRPTTRERHRKCRREHHRRASEPCPETRHGYQGSAECTPAFGGSVCHGGDVSAIAEPAAPRGSMLLGVEPSRILTSRHATGEGQALVITSAALGDSARAARSTSEPPGPGWRCREAGSASHPLSQISRSEVPCAARA